MLSENSVTKGKRNRKKKRREINKERNSMGREETRGGDSEGTLRERERERERILFPG